MLVNTSGGVAGGDRLQSEVTALGRITLTSQAAEKIYRAIDESARISTTLAMYERAKIAWCLPCEIGLIEGSCRTYGGPDFPSIVHFCLPRKDIDAWEGVNERKDDNRREQLKI